MCCILRPNQLLGDDRFERSEIKDHYTRFELLFWVKLKAPWPIR